MNVDPYVAALIAGCAVAFMASAAISVIPCLVIFGVLQRYLVNSIATTGLKG